MKENKNMCSDEKRLNYIFDGMNLMSCYNEKHF